MATATAINGFPIPQTGDAPNVAADMTALANAIDLRAPAKFASTTLRDSTITTPTEGMACYILGSGLWDYDGTAWRPVGRRTVTTGNYSGSSVTSASTALVSVTSVHGQTFTLARARTISINITSVISGTVAGDLWAVSSGIDGSVMVKQQHAVPAAGGPGSVQITSQSAPTTLAAGSHSLVCQLQRLAGTGTITILAAVLAVIDEGPA